MTVIKLQTYINADQQIVFDLSRNIDLHQISTKQTNEKAVAGRCSGLIELNETVTWQARHFGITQKLTSKITEFNNGNYFVDEMVKGIFKSIRHEHHFAKEGDGTLMTDVFNYVSPLGLLGKIADIIFLSDYLKNLLIKRNSVIKEYAERNLKA
ncbi:MAG: SRPBCC family protein [Candidatus Pedobacter colombiensis]|uniref:SRPBCC family protein n=1 Tax=Candidatus Pedobacter colombiensis TaxID=3121371 RepID=A0AAJ6B5F5_9SPHI|nr:SRPBCC family protein [Pedobacter sp.]WEK17431.1 MAG: SRPBCC family protein [Pedobacter sp.]